MASKLQRAGFFDQEGRLFTPTMTTTWNRPLRVDLLSGFPQTTGERLRIVDREKAAGSSTEVKPPPGLLESFMNLADASGDRIQKFAAKYGRLEVFTFPRKARNFKCEWIEYCEIWRYLARSMHALLMIVADFDVGGRGSKADWEAIIKMPEAIRRMKSKWLGGQENRWMRMAFALEYHGSDNEESGTFIYLLNALLGMGNVRASLEWRTGSSRPRLVYASSRLLSHLALQLCLRVTRREAFVICHHCQREFTPPFRAPKIGQRSFCPECREAGEPKRYALRDYRARKLLRNQASSSFRVKL